MTASLLNIIVAPDVNALIDKAIGHYATDTTFRPGIPREQAAAIIHAVLWACGSRADSFANAYAHDALFRAIDANGVLDWLNSMRAFEKKHKTREQEEPDADT